MAKISVNDQYLVNGRLTVRRFKDEEGNIAIEGSFITHYYFEEITTLNTYRYSVTDIEVVEEIFGSDDVDIIYNFIAKDIDNNFDMSNLSREEIVELEEKMYGNDGYVLGSLLEGLKKKECDN